MTWRRRGDGGVLNASDLMLLAAVASLPWFWGGVGIGAFRAAAALIAAAAGWTLARRGPSGLGLGRGGLWTVPAFALAAWGFLQSTPLPRGVVTALSPGAAALQDQALGTGAPDAAGWLRQIEAAARARVPEAAAEARSERPYDPGPDAPAPPGTYRLSLDPGATIERTFWFLALLAAFLLVSTRASDPGRHAVYRWTVFGSSGALAAAGLANRLTAPGTLLWLREAPEESRAFGAYVNPAHFAMAMELSVPWMLGYALSPLEHGRGWRGLGPGRWIAMLLALLGLAAATLAASKTAMLTLGVSSAAILAVAAHRGRAWRRLAPFALAVGVAIAVVAVAGPLRGRVSDFVSIYGASAQDTDRRIVWSVGLRAAKDFPLTGSGLGAFRVVIPSYLPAGERDQWLQMHNDYLEVLIGGGVVAAALAIGLAIAFVGRFAGAVRLAASAGRVLPVLGIGLGLVSVAVHEFVEFGLQTPGNALLFVTIAACGVAPLASSREDS